MKLLRHGAKGAEKPALLDAQGKLRDLSKVLPDISAAALTPKSLQRLRDLEPHTLPLVAEAGPLAVPWAGMGKFIAIGLNYADHAAESNLPVPKEPIVFMKATSCAVGPNDAGGAAAGQRQERLGGRARRGHRQPRALRVRSRCAEARGRLLRGQRRVRARIPDRARRHLGQGQGLRHLRPHRPVAGDGRRDPRPAEPGACGSRSTATAGRTAARAR